MRAESALGETSETRATDRPSGTSVLVTRNACNVGCRVEGGARRRLWIALAVAGLVGCGGRTGRSDGPAAVESGLPDAGRDPPAGLGPTDGARPSDAGARGADAAPANAAGDDGGDGCPRDIPPHDTPCSAPPSLLCEYGDCRAETGMASSCKDGAWVTVRVACTPLYPSTTCPAELPEQRSPCNHVRSLECLYPDCRGAKTIKARCIDELLWQVFPGACDPPLPPLSEECPDAQPVKGTPCAVLPAKGCYYGECVSNGSRGRNVLATCEPDYVWQVVTYPCPQNAPPAD